MSDFSKLFDAIAERDATAIRTQILANHFVLLSVSDEEDQSEEEAIGALTAEVGDFDVLVAFSGEDSAGAFVGEMDELFDEAEGVDGFVVGGDSLLEYLPEGFGILLDPESENACVIDPTLAAEVNQPTA